MSQVVNRNQIINIYIYIYVYIWYDFYFEKPIYIWFLWEKYMIESNPEFSYLNMQLSWLVFAVTI